ncbi:MAG: hypothetical protein KJ822_03810 [Proteobacteria bacterium]|nr:hypothetical protein [Pseudomonadota bacterium]MBU4354455.1 hypothetical protein [Pseudomonadota bacterium]
MGPITEATTRLVGEIKAGHAERLSFVKDLKREVAAMRQGFRRANDERVREVAALLAGFRREHKERARTVMALRHEVAADLAGAHRAWFGPSPAERRAMAAAKRRAEAEAERLTQEAAERDRLAALAMAKEEAIRHQAAQKAEEAKVTKPEPTGHAKKK